MILKQPDEKEFEQIKLLVEDLWLDNEDMYREQFHIVSDNGNVIAFGRLREHTDATELCTMGVAKDYQGKKLGEKIVKYLLTQARRDVYLVTTIPGFFTKLGFVFAEEHPKSLQRKVDICTAHYHVGETYRVMRWERKLA